jgi:uncharacterized membrane protein
MKKERLGAFSDGVIAIIITIMVLELKVPNGEDIRSLAPLLPEFISYVLSFIYVGIYWNNHHHMLYAIESVNGKILWANLAFLFWLSLVPFATEWMGESHFSPWPIMLYGFILMMNGLTYTILARQLVLEAGPQSELAKAFGKDWKSKLSVVIYAVAVIISYFCSWVGFGLYWVVALIWIIPDTRIEKKVTEA